MKYIFLLAIIFLLAAGCGDGNDEFTQGEVDFTVINQGFDAWYVDWSTSPEGVVSCQVEVGGNWEPCRFFPPSCTNECSKKNLQQGCCINCEPPQPSVKVIESRGFLSVFWPGDLHPLDENHCSECSCYRVENALPGNYRAGICIYPDYICEIESCGEPEYKVITGAAPAGEPTCYEVDFTVPYTDLEYLMLAVL